MCNLKISPHKVRILLDDTEVYGYRIRKSHVHPSPHIVSNLGEVKIDDLKTIKQVNSWRGLYKTLIAHLPHLAFYMNPFDKATAGRKSIDKMDWTPELRAAFNAASAHLGNINRTYLPHPEDKLILKPDTAKVKLCTGWALYAVKKDSDKLLPVQYCSAKLSDYMKEWYPCELEGTGAVLAIDQVSHWINESRHPTTVMPDSMPVVKAANLMKSGKHSKNPRLQSLLACVNRRNVIFVHSSAKNGQHIVPDALSRLGRGCDCKDCGVKRFLDEITDKVELMAMEIPKDISSIILSDMEPCQIAAMSPLLNEMMVNELGVIPFGNKKAWREIQESDPDCKKTISMKKGGDLPSKKHSNKFINRLFRECTVNEDGLLVVNRFDQRTMRHMDRIVVPRSFLLSIIALIHNRLRHPKLYQLQSMFEKYFFSFGVQEVCKELRAGCDICLGLDGLPREMEEFKPEAEPEHPGTHMNADIVRRAGQKIMVNIDQFSGYMTACFTETENREDLAEALISTVTPIRHSATILVRVDQAPAFQSLLKSPSDALEANGVLLEIGEDFNKNSNCQVDKKIQELEEEFRRLAPEGEKLSMGQLAQAVTMLNNRTRNQNLSAGEIHFSRDPVRGINLNLDDEKLKEEKLQKREANQTYSIRSKARGGGPCKKAECEPGDIVYVKNHGTKHEVRNPFIVTAEGRKDTEVAVRKVLHPYAESSKFPAFSSDQKFVDKKFLYMKTERIRKQDQQGWKDKIYEELEDNYQEDDEDIVDEYEEGQENEVTEKVWDPTPSYSDDEDCFMIVRHGDRTDAHEDYETVGIGIDNREPSVEPPVGAEDGQLIKDQSRDPKRGDRVVIFNDVDNKWMLVKLTSGKNKYYRKTGPYYNFRADDGNRGGQYLRPGGLWSYVTREAEESLDLDNIVMDQADDGLGEERSSEGSSDDVVEEEDRYDPPAVEVAVRLHDPGDGPQTPREIRQQRRWVRQSVNSDEALEAGHPTRGVDDIDDNTDGVYIDDGYTDQDSVFGDTEAEFVLSRLQDKFNVSHRNYYVEQHVDPAVRAYRISEALDVAIPKGSEMAVTVEQFEDYPSAASFPNCDVGVPNYNYHLSRKRLQSLSAPDLCEQEETGSAWQRIRHSRLWKWGRTFRRR